MHKKEPRPHRINRKLQSIQFATHSRSGSPVTVHLLSGVRLSGLVLSTDDYVLLLGRHPGDRHPQVIYKHAISCVMPAGADLAPLEEFADSPDFVDLFIPRGRRRG